MQTPFCRQLLENIKALNQVVVAFSGGVDSSLLAFAAHAGTGRQDGGNYRANALYP